MHDLRLEIDPIFYRQHADLYCVLMDTIQWDESMRARKTASFGQPYNYSQMEYAPKPLPQCLELMVAQLQSRLGIAFNNCLLNYYESGANTMGFHSDETSGLVSGTGVAIVSLGSARDITYRSIEDPSFQRSFPLEPGSLLYMDDEVQLHWQHAIRRSDGAGPRISLTWRAVALTDEMQ